MYFGDLKKYIFGWFTFNSCSISVPMAFRKASRKKNYYWPTFCITMFLLLEFGKIVIHFWRTVNQFLGLLPWGSLANLKKFKRKHSWQEIIFSKVNNNLLIFFARINYFHMSVLKVRSSLKKFHGSMNVCTKIHFLVTKVYSVSFYLLCVCPPFICFLLKHLPKKKEVPLE